MPGCYLHVAGTEFDPDAFLQTSSLQPYSVWHVGEPLAASGRRASRLHEWAGFKCNVSDVNGDLDGEISDAIAFLATHYESLMALTLDQAVEDRRLDFGFNSRVGSPNVAMQGEWLPVKFLSMVAELRIGVALSIYPGPHEQS